MVDARVDVCLSQLVNQFDGDTEVVLQNIVQWCRLKNTHNGGVELSMEENQRLSTTVNLSQELDCVLKKYNCSTSALQHFQRVNHDKSQIHVTTYPFEILTKLQEQQSGGKYCDLIIEVDGEHFRAHKSILVSASQYFSFELESSSSCNSHKLNMDVEAPTFRAVLDFIYSGKIVINAQNCTQLEHASELLKIQALSHVCKNWETLPLQPNGGVTENLKNCPNANDAQTSPVSKATLLLSFPESLKEDACNENEDDLILTNNIQPQEDGANSAEIQLKDSTSTAEDFVCAICKQCFSQAFTYKLHLLCHDDRQVYKCSRCNFRENTSDKVRLHLQDVHGEPFLQPNSQAEDEEEGKSEEEDTQDEDGDDTDAFACHKCTRTFTSKKSLTRHSLTHATTPRAKKAPVKRVRAAWRSFACQQCSKQFKCSSHLTRHMLSHTGIRKHCCTTCGKLFLKSDHLKRHEQIHSSERPFNCDKCDKTFRNKDHLKRHQLTHSEDRPFFCEMCGKQFKDKSSLISHQKCHVPASHSCKECDKMFKSEERLNVHCLKHSEAKPFSCDVCGKKFPAKGRLTKHMFTHTDFKPFHCETCGKQFRESQTLRLHQKKHTGIGLHPCLQCGKQFTNAGHLRRHGKVHSGEKPHVCELCKRAFARVDNLDAHRRICSVEQLKKKSNRSDGFSSSGWDATSSPNDEPESSDANRLALAKPPNLGPVSKYHLMAASPHTSSTQSDKRSSDHHFSNHHPNPTHALPPPPAVPQFVPSMAATDLMTSMLSGAFADPHVPELPFHGANLSFGAGSSSRYHHH